MTPTKRVKATVAYDGSGFHGFAVNRDVRTVAGEIEAALATICQEPVVITCAGRTDKGVHGRGQVISFDVPTDRVTDPGRLERSINRLCRPRIVLRDTTFVEHDFDARFSATWRRYGYRVLNRDDADPLLHGRVWHVREPLDVAAMNAAMHHVLGEHDFTSFGRVPKVDEGQTPPSMVREVLEAEWSVVDELTVFEVRATSFVHQMVRSLVGTSVDVGLGRVDPTTIPAILAARNRHAAGRVAPPEGLTLWDVGYD